MPAPPPYRQARSDTCALACLRMVLARYGRKVKERELAGEVRLDAGLDIEDLAQVAEQFDLTAEIESPDLENLSELLSAETYPIVYLNRVHLDRRFPVPRRLALRRCVVHAVVPVRITHRYVWFNDPRPGRMRRVSIKKFEAARRDLSGWCVVCVPRTDS